MVNKIFISLLFAILISLSACSTFNTTKLQTPFVTVVKLIDAERSLHLNEALEFIDVEQVYSRMGSKNPKEDWEKGLRFLYNLGKDKKFTNNFEYYHYDIEENISENKASIRFIAKDETANIKMISYGLEKRQNKWIVISIDYFKKE